MRALVSILRAKAKVALLITVGLATQAVHAQSLPELEALYQTALQAKQQPLLQTYLSDLTAKLAKTSGTEADAFRFEIARIHGLLNDKALYQRQAAPLSKSTLGMKPGIVLTLDPQEADPPQPLGSTVPLGTASWRFRHLEPGVYQLVGQCVCGSVVPDKATVTATYHGQSMVTDIMPRHRSKDGVTPKFITLARITLTEAVNDESLTLTASPGDTAWMQVKVLHLARVPAAR